MRAQLIENNFKRTEDPYNSIGVGDVVYKIKSIINNALNELNINTKIIVKGALNIKKGIDKEIEFYFSFHDIYHKLYSFKIQYYFTSDKFIYIEVRKKGNLIAGIFTYNYLEIDNIIKSVINENKITLSESISFERKQDSHESLGVGNYSKIKNDIINGFSFIFKKIFLPTTIRNLQFKDDEKYILVFIKIRTSPVIEIYYGIKYDKEIEKFIALKEKISEDFKGGNTSTISEIYNDLDGATLQIIEWINES